MTGSHRWMTHSIALAIALGLLTVGCGADAGDPEVEPSIENADGGTQPNILVVVVDALRRDHLGAYGYDLPTSPELDAVASEGVRFTNAFSHSTWTKPSIATLFTSLYPEQHGIDRVGYEAEEGFRTDRLGDEFQTLAEHFRAGGYRTGGFVANVHLQDETGFAQGFQRFSSIRLKTASELNGMLMDWLLTKDRQPFFAYLHYMDVHWPYKQYLPETRGKFGNTKMVSPPPWHWERVAAWTEKHLTDRSLKSIQALYDEEVSYIDRAVGDLIDSLQAAGIFDNTIVWVTADHGEGFFEHEELQHGFDPYEEVIQIPLIATFPAWMGVDSRNIGHLVGLVDLMPTMLDLAALPTPEEIEGRSLVPLLAGETLPERPIYLDGEDFMAIRNSSHKVVVKSGSAMSVCFDLRVDPGEQDPVQGPGRGECDELAGQLEILRARLADYGSSRDAPGTVPLDPDEVEALRSLGYLGD